MNSSVSATEQAVFSLSNASSEANNSANTVLSEMNMMQTTVDSIPDLDIDFDEYTARSNQYTSQAAAIVNTVSTNNYITKRYRVS